MYRKSVGWRQGWSSPWANNVACRGISLGQNRSAHRSSTKIHVEGKTMNIQTAPTPLKPKDLLNQPGSITSLNHMPKNNAASPVVQCISDESCKRGRLNTCELSFFTEPPSRVCSVLFSMRRLF